MTAPPKNRQALIRELQLNRQARQVAAEERARKEQFASASPEELEELISARGQAVEHLWFLSMRELLSIAKEPSFLIPDMIPFEGITLLAGIPGSAKTLLVNDLALAISQGRPWLGVPHTGRRLRTLWINHDTPGSLMAHRLKRLGATVRDQILTHTIGGKEPDTGSSEDALPSALILPDAAEQIMALVEYYQPSLIVFDSLRQSHNLDENDSAKVGGLMRLLRKFASRGAAVIALHHLRKTDKLPNSVEEFESMLRGSGELAGSADATLFIAKGQQFNTLLRGKTRSWMPVGPATTNFAVVDVPREGVGNGLEIKPVAEFEPLRMLLSPGPLGRREIAKILKLSREECAKLIELAMDEGIVYETKRAKAGDSSKIALVPAGYGGDE